MAIIEQVIPEWKDNKLKEISKSTLKEVQDKLTKFNRVLAVRPTGFGKSYMLSGLTSTVDDSGNLIYKNCLYVYPTTIIKEDVSKTYGPAGKDERANMLRNTTFISYKKLTNMIIDLERGKKTTVGTKEIYKGIFDVVNDAKKDNIVEIDSYSGENGLRNWFRQFDLVMLDECHRAGSVGFTKTWEKIGSIITVSANTKLVGVTATPDRLDGKNIREIFGKQNEIYKLTLKQCIKQELLSKFDYVYIIGDRSRFLSTTIDDINRRRQLKGDIDLQEYEISELNEKMNSIEPIYSIIRNSVTDENTGGSNYMKFVVFFRDKIHIRDYGDKVRNWFEDAFPEKDLAVYNIVTKSGKDNIDYEITDTDKLSELEPTENKLDLIFCVDKLNMGYHVESITGVVLLRETSSAVIYNQQIGRCFSVRSMNKPIIFDIIDKCGAGTILDKKESNEEVSSGTKRDLPSIIDRGCVDLKNYSEEFLRLAVSIRNQKYDNKKEIVLFLSNNRHAPIEVISQMTGYKMSDIKEILSMEDK